MITGNNITGGTGRQTVALELVDGPSTVDSNLIISGCGLDLSTGVVMDGSTARLQNNRILSGQCADGSSANAYGVHVFLGSSTGEPDLNSNDIEPMATSGDCQSTGVAMERSAGDSTPAGILRNNIVFAGSCNRRFAVAELANAAARIVENNDLYSAPASSAPDASTETSVLYRRGDVDALTAARVNALDGAAENISTDPKYVAYPTNLRLTAGSPCRDRGTAEGAPDSDADGNARPQPVGGAFDIGAYEFSSQ
jgi:hypothetical protein